MTEASSYIYPKSLHEALCAAQSTLAEAARQGMNTGSAPHWIDHIGMLINQIDEHRPLGVNGKHGDRHTPTCGCDGHTGAWGIAFQPSISVPTDRTPDETLTQAAARAPEVLPEPLATAIAVVLLDHSEDEHPDPNIHELAHVVSNLPNPLMRDDLAAMALRLEVLRFRNTELTVQLGQEQRSARAERGDLDGLDHLRQAQPPQATGAS